MNLGYTGKPYDTATGMYNYGYRDYKPTTARFTTVDPIRDGSNWFVYVNNDPVNWIDLFGLSASDGQSNKSGRTDSDTFSPPDEAATDFGLKWNGISIEENVEYGSVIIKQDDEYTYMDPITQGHESHIDLPTPEGGVDDAVAGLHTHGAYDEGFVNEYGDGNNIFSQTDIGTAEEYGKPFYVSTPDGTLQVYEPDTDTVRVISTDMPSDPNDPGRKNNIDP